METLRLQRIQRPSRVEQLLELFIVRTNQVPQRAYQIRDPSGLSGILQDLVRQARAKHRVWSAWTDDRTTWVFTVEMSLAESTVIDGTSA